MDTEGNRVLAKYYPRPKDASVPDSKISSVKEQKAFEKGLWEKTKKPGGPFVVGSPPALSPELWTFVRY